MSNNQPVVKSVLASLPNFLSTNARSLYPKIDELALLLNHLCVEIAGENYGCPLDPIVVLEILNIFMGVLYNPPDKSALEQREIVNYRIETLDHAPNKFPDCGIILLRDFNNLNISIS